MDCGAKCAGRSGITTRGDPAPLADLEALAIDRAQAGEPPYPALETALEKAEAGDAAAAKQLQAIDAMAPPA